MGAISTNPLVLMHKDLQTGTKDATFREHWGAQSIDTSAPPISLTQYHSLKTAAGYGVSALNDAAAYIGGAFASWWSARSTDWKDGICDLIPDL
jgi:hypothetical protein